MALIIYPTTNYDSFVSLVDASTYINSFTLDGVTWDALASATQESLLRIACRTILLGIDEDTDPLPDPAPACLGEANALIASHDNMNNLSAGTETGALGAVKKEKAGAVEVQYYDTKNNSTFSVSPIPSLVMPCLEELGYVLPSVINGLKQLTLGRS